MTRSFSYTLLVKPLYMLVCPLYFHVMPWIYYTQYAHHAHLYMLLLQIGVLCWLAYGVIQSCRHIDVKPHILIMKVLGILSIGVLVPSHWRCRHRQMARGRWPSLSLEFVLCYYSLFIVLISRTHSGSLFIILMTQDSRCIHSHALGHLSCLLMIWVTIAIPLFIALVCTCTSWWEPQ